MIKDVIRYKNNIILTIYHRGFDCENSMRKRIIKEKIGRNLIVFTEEIARNDEWDLHTEYDMYERSLVLPDEKINPYKDSACGFMEHKIYIKKPNVILSENGRILKGDAFVEVLDFIEKYTGMDLHAQPTLLGDVFLFSMSDFNYKSNEKKSVILYDLKAGIKIIIHFKNLNGIIESKIIDVKEDKDNIEVETDFDWKSHDLEVYLNDRLIYKRNNICYVRNMIFNMFIKESPKKIPLKSGKSDFKLQQSHNYDTFNVGRDMDQKKKAIFDINRLMREEISNYEGNNKIIFITPGEEQKARDIITDGIFGDAEELWVFDPYFMDINHGVDKIIDWVRLIVHAKAAKRNIYFYSSAKPDYADVRKPIELIKNDHVIKEGMKLNKDAKLNLIQTKAPIHDRFIISRNNNKMTGIAIGTSLNSLNGNHYCIYKLDSFVCNSILEKLLQWAADNVVSEEVICYEK